MEIKRDIVATIQGPGWSYGMSRVLIDKDGLAAVFVTADGPPAQTFTVVEDRPGGGVGKTDDGGVVKYRRRGSSCSYKLAKCQTSTKTLVGRWEAWLVS